MHPSRVPEVTAPPRRAQSPIPAKAPGACGCWCHAPYVRRNGCTPSLRDTSEAALACDQCGDAHTRALYETALAYHAGLAQ